MFDIIQNTISNNVIIVGYRDYRDISGCGSLKIFRLIWSWNYFLLIKMFVFCLCKNLSDSNKLLCFNWIFSRRGFHPSIDIQISKFNYLTPAILQHIETYYLLDTKKY